MGDKMKKETKHDEIEDSFAKRHDQLIKCDVESCKHQNSEDGCCKLPEIKVNCCCNPEEASDKDVTICDSFECDCGCNDQEKTTEED